MRRVLYSVAASLDGYIAGPDGEVNWIPEEPSIDWQAFMSRFDTVLMGRITYETAVALGPLPDMRRYVFSRTLQAAEHPQVTVVSSDQTALVKSLREADGRDIWLMGGGMLFRSLLAVRLVDGVEVAVVPVLLGEGVPLLPALNHRHTLKLKNSHIYPGGIALLNYDVNYEIA